MEPVLELPSVSHLDSMWWCPAGRGRNTHHLFSVCVCVCVCVWGKHQIIEEGLHGSMGLACSVERNDVCSAGETFPQRLKGRPRAQARASVRETITSILRVCPCVCLCVWGAAILERKACRGLRAACFEKGEGCPHMDLRSRRWVERGLLSPARCPRQGQSLFWGCVSVCVTVYS